MKLFFPFWFFPALVFYVDSFSQFKKGESRAMVVRIDKACKSDRGLLEHELQHVARFYQFWIIGIVLLMLIASVLNSPWLPMPKSINDTVSIFTIVLTALPTYALLYILSKKFRFNEECKCYQIQCRYSITDQSEIFAYFVATKYKLSYSKEQALNKIRDGDYGQLTRASQIH